MSIGLSKRRLLGLVAGAIMSVGLVAPTLADSGTVTVTGTNNAQLIFTIGGTEVITNTVSGAAVSFGTSLDPSGGTNGCFQASNPVAFSIKSNRSYNGEVSAATNAGNTSNIPVGQVYWAHAPSATCASTPFSTSADITWRSGGKTSGDNFSDSYAIQVLWNNDPGAVDMTLTYAVAQAQ